jgi:hypothetical protein
VSDLWIVLIEDRHADVEASPFSTEEAAVTAARRMAAEYARDPEDVGDAALTVGMRQDGWVLYLPYGPEGDCVRVLKRQMAEETREADGGDTMAGGGGEVKSSLSDDLENPGRVEYGLLMSGGGFHVRSESPAVERIYPAQDWMKAEVRSGGHVYRRRIVVAEDWEEWIIPRDSIDG